MQTYLSVVDELSSEQDKQIAELIQQTTWGEKYNGRSWHLLVPRLRILAFNGAQCIGNVSVTTVTCEPKHSTAVDSLGALVVAAEYRNCGLGKKLLVAAINNSQPTKIAAPRPTYIQRWLLNLEFQQLEYGHILVNGNSKENFFVYGPAPQRGTTLVYGY
jgi:predicted N-acetyltransferase YhbS